MNKMKKVLPKLERWLLGFFLNHRHPETVIGDFEENYLELRVNKGIINAKLWLWGQIIMIMPAFINNSFYWSTAMFKNYLKITFRNILKHKGYSTINILGLAIGMACCILITGYIGYELSFDKYHENSKNIYRAASYLSYSGREMENAVNPTPWGPQLVEEFPEVLSCVRFFDEVKIVASNGKDSFFERNAIFTDNSIFEVFSFRLLEGDPQNALTRPFTVVITPETAEKYFGAGDPVGKVLRINNSLDCTITGVIEKPPVNSHFTFDMLFSLESRFVNAAPRKQNWLNWNSQTYILLQEGTAPEDLNVRLAEFNQKHILDRMPKNFNVVLESFLQPLASIHLSSNIERELGVNSDIRYIYVFAAIAVFILLIACFNFMNLSTARSSKRAREVGMRKVMGAERGKLIFQFLGESLVFSVIAIVIGLVLAIIAQPYLNIISGKNISLDLFNMPLIVGSVFVIVIFAGLIAGSYPALFLSAFKPISVLKGQIQRGNGASNFRRILVITQFVISITLIISTGIVFNQLKFMMNKNLGFNKEQVVVLKMEDNDAFRNAETLNSELRRISGVVGTSGSGMVPFDDNMSVTGYFPEGLETENGILLETFTIDHDFLDLYEIELVEGRNFSKEMGQDEQTAILLNESAVRKLQWDNPLGKKIERVRGSDFNNRISLTVVGIIKDIHHRSLYKKIEPALINYSTTGLRRVSVRIDIDNINETMKDIESRWKEVNPNSPFDYFFLDDSFEEIYRSEKQLGDIFLVFAVLAIIIGCLGLFGLASFTAEQRTKEIGIRKVLGSSINSILVLLCREFVILIIAANVLSWPLAYFFTSSWLGNFPYRAGFDITSFLFAGAGALLIAVITVSYQAIKAALADPVRSLRYE
ncbi:MAG: FtsX-like permease family protein [bacterium]|nr:FtsX-like permease family protein [bacterium]